MDLQTILQPLRNDQERLFVHARLRGMSEIAAFRAAGGKSNPSPNSWCKAPHVLEVLRNAQNVSAEETGVTRDRIKDMLMEAYANATTAAEQIMAARELAKLYGHYAPTTLKVQHNHQHKVSIEERRKQIKDLSTSDLEQMLALDGEFTVVQPPHLLEHDA